MLWLQRYRPVDERQFQGYSFYIWQGDVEKLKSEMDIVSQEMCHCACDKIFFQHNGLATLFPHWPTALTGNDAHQMLQCRKRPYFITSTVSAP